VEKPRRTRIDSAANPSVCSARNLGTPVRRLEHTFHQAVGDDAIISVQNPVVITEYWEPQPDVCLLRPRADFYARAHPRAEDVLLVVEVADTSGGDDRQRKVPEYGRAGIPEAWLVDLERDLIEVYRDPGPRYHTVSVSKRGDKLAPLAFPTVSVSVGEVLGPEA
jgi:Uma2 family endonuclease